MSITWIKPEDPVDRSWFAPLEYLTELSQSRGLDAVNPDHFLYAGRAELPGASTVHIYRHIGTRKFLNVDERGEMWRYKGTGPKGDPRFDRIYNLADALAAVELFRGNLLAGHLRSMARGAAPHVEMQLTHLDAARAEWPGSLPDRDPEPDALDTAEAAPDAPGTYEAVGADV